MREENDEESAWARAWTRVPEKIDKLIVVMGATAFVIVSLGIASLSFDRLFAGITAEERVETVSGTVASIEPRFEPNLPILPMLGGREVACVYMKFDDGHAEAVPATTDEYAAIAGCSVGDAVVAVKKQKVTTASLLREGGVVWSEDYESVKLADDGRSKGERTTGRAASSCG